MLSHPFAEESLPQLSSQPSLLRACFGVLLITAPTLAADRPNIVYILADDLGIGDIGPYGQQKIQTPFIDAMAGRGTSFMNAFCPAAVCTPTRSALMTGFHNGHSNADRNAGNAVLRSYDVTVAEVLKGAGYSTGLVGKWGLGGAVGTADDPVLDPADADSLPTVQGFDEVLTHLNQGHAHDYYADYLWQSDPGAPEGMSRIATNGQNSHTLFAQRGVQFIADHAGDANPFYLQVSYTPPHQDIDAAPQSFKDMYAGLGWTTKQVNHAATISYLDWGVGELVKRIEDPNGDGDTSDSVAANTIFIFASDNGPTSADGADPNFFDSNGIYRGEKRDLYDGGVRSPLIVRWDRHVAAGATNTSYFGSHTDFLPTAAELAGAPVPLGLDGSSMASFLTGSDETWRQLPFLVWESHEGNGGTTGARSPQWAAREGDFKLIRFDDGSYEMYNLKLDPSETTNIVGANATLKARLESIATAELVTRSDRYAVEYANWTGGSGAWGAAGNWNKGSLPQDNWIASLGNTTGSLKSTQVTGHTKVLAFEAGGAAAPVRVDVDPGVTLTARNGVRLHNGATLNLRAATLDTVRLVEIDPGAAIEGSGAVRGVVVNKGRVSPGQAQVWTPPTPVNTGVIEAIRFNFTGIQDVQPLTQTSILSQHVVLTAGLQLGPGLNFRGAANAGSEFNVAGFGAGTSYASAVTANDYLTFTVAPISGLTMLLDRVFVSLWRNGTNAPRDYAIATSLDAFASTIGTLNLTTAGSTTNQATMTGSYTGTTRTSNPLEVRVYGWNAPSTTGNTHFTGASLYASFQSIPGQTLGVTDTLQIAGDLEHLPGATLEMDILDGITFDQLDVAGRLLSSGGNLKVRLGQGYVPAVGARFDLLDFSSFSGAFSFDLAPLPGGMWWDTSALGTLGEIRAAALPGDANLNGVIDRDDLSLLDRGYSLGLSGWSNGDFDLNGVINGVDYSILYQGLAGQGGGWAAVVPEPAGMGVGAGVWVIARRKKRGRGEYTAGR